MNNSPTFFLLTVLLSVSTLQLHTHHDLFRRQPPRLDRSILNPLTPSPTPNPTPASSSNPATNSNPSNASPSGSQRAGNFIPTPSDSPSTSSNPNPISKDSPLLPLLASSLNVPPASPNPLTNVTSTPVANLTSASPTPTFIPPPTPTTSANKIVAPTNLVPGSSPSPLATQSAAPNSANRSTPSNPTTTNRAENRTSPQEKSTFGSTTIKIIAITAGVVAGLFLLWTVIRKWKFRPSKRFASKLEDYDENFFEPRPPSFSEKRPNGYPLHAAEKIPIPRPDSSAQYSSHVPERAHTPHNLPRQNLFAASSPPFAAHRLSHSSLTKPLPIFEPNPYRLSLGLGSEISHSYPPSDNPPLNRL